MIALLAALILSADFHPVIRTGSAQYDYLLRCELVEMEYQYRKGVAQMDLLALEAALQCSCMLESEGFVAQMSSGIVPDYIRPDINKACRAKVKVLLSPKPQRKEKCK